MDLSCIEQNSSKFRPIALVIDDIAKQDPERPWAVVPRDWQNLEDGFKDITFSQFAQAIDKAAWYRSISHQGSIS